MIRIERDPAFWTAIASHPDVASALLGLPPEKVGALARRPEILPIASDHGGFLFSRLDALGFVCELHTLFTPEGRGREALTAGISSVGVVWLSAIRPSSHSKYEPTQRAVRPEPSASGRRVNWRATPLGDLRMWTLTQSAWNLSSARRIRCPL